MTCVNCIIAGDAPPVQAIEARIALLQGTPVLLEKFKAVAAIYWKDENSLTQGQFAFIAFLEQFICYNTTPDPIL